MRTESERLQLLYEVNRRLATFTDLADLLRYATRRGLLGNEEGDRLLAEVYAAQQKRMDKAADRERAQKAKARAKAKPVKRVKVIKAVKKTAKGSRKR